MAISIKTGLIPHIIKNLFLIKAIFILIDVYEVRIESFQLYYFCKPKFAKSVFAFFFFKEKTKPFILTSNNLQNISPKLFFLVGRGSEGSKYKRSLI